MVHRTSAGQGLALMALALALGGTASSAQASQSPNASPTGQAATAPFVPADFAVPTRAQGEGFQLVPLGPSLVKIDYEAYMSSVEHLHKTFTRSNAWPHDGISDADAMKDMETEQARFAARTSFAYAVLTPDGARERGCVYVYPSKAPGYDAQVTMWVTKADYDAGFEDELFAFVQTWMKAQWPFARVAYPGRAPDWETWDALVKEG